MPTGFSIIDANHTRTDADIGYTLIGTDSELGEGTFKFTFPMENPYDYIIGWHYQITDSSTADTLEPVYHLNNIASLSITTQTVVDNTSGLCIVNGDYSSTITTSSTCNSTSGGVWDVTTPHFAYFEGTVAYLQVGKYSGDDVCFSGTNTFSDLKDGTELTMYFLAMGAI